MPIPLAPNTSPADASGAFAILAIIGDEGKYKKRLEELQKQATDMEKMFENSKKLDADAARKLKDAEKLQASLEQREAELKAREDSLSKARYDTLQLQEQLNQRQAKFDEDNEKRAKVKEAGLNKFSQDLIEKEKVLTAAMRDLEAKQQRHLYDSQAAERALAVRSSELAKREDQFTADKAKLEEQKAVLQAKMSKLDELRAAIQNAA